MPFTPGDPNINRSGRPRGARNIRKYIESKTDNGLEIIDRLLAFARDPKSPKREAKEVWIHLLDRLIGKPETSTSIALTMSERPLGETILNLAPEDRLAFLDGLKARKELGPGVDELQEKSSE